MIAWSWKTYGFGCRSAVRDLFLSGLRLINVRCHEDISVGLGPRATLVLGPNGAGKTSILEAVHILLTGSAPRGRMRDVIRRGSDYLRITGSLQESAEADSAGRADRDLAFGYHRSGERRASEDGRSFSGPREMRERLLPARMFTPDDLRLVKAEPSWRRGFLDEAAVGYLPAHGERLREYREGLTQRNALLRRGSLGNEHEPWEEILACRGPEIVTARKTLLSGLSPQISSLHARLAGPEVETLHLAYRTNCADLAANQFRERMRREREADRRRGFTYLGPHRDDVRFRLGALDVRDVGSQGEQRTAVLALILAEREWSRQQTGIVPLLLLDDVMSELDTKRRRAVMDILLEDGQSVLTAAETGYFQGLNMDEVETVDLAAGGSAT